MLFLEEHFKEEADHITAMSNTTSILHKTKEKQLPLILGKGAVMFRADSTCLLDNTKTSDFPEVNRVTSLGLTLHSTIHCTRWLFSSIPVENRAHITLMLTAPVCSRELRGAALRGSSAVAGQCTKCPPAQSATVQCAKWPPARKCHSTVHKAWSTGA